MPSNFFAIVPDAPDFACRVVAIDVATLQLGEFRAVINNATGKRASFGVMMLCGGFHEGSRARLSQGIKGMGTFHHAPAVVVALANEVNLFP